MKKSPAKNKYSIGELVSAAYQQAGRITPNRRVAAILASKILELWLAKSDRPELVQRLRTAQA